MFEVTVEAHFSAAHQLVGYRGDCARLHGHNWKVEVSVVAKELDELGMAINFQWLKRLIGEVIDRYDHQNLNSLDEFKEINPTTENLASLIFHRLNDRLEGKPVDIYQVRIWESEGNSAAYREG